VPKGHGDAIEISHRHEKEDNMHHIRIISWNVNGIRACASRGFRAWLDRSGADIVGLQETRARPEQFPDDVRTPPGWHVHIVAGKRAGYSGVALYSRVKPDEVDISLGVDEHDAEGRLEIARFGRLRVVNVYFPNGSGKNRDNSRVPFKLDFYRRLFDRLEPLRQQGEPVIVLGDFNTAHREIDLARPKSNQKTSGFLPEERAELDRWLSHGWVDTFRHLHPDRTDAYSWWSQRFGARARNVGWRIDYVLITESLLPALRDAFILSEVMGSDHCPIGIELSCKELNKWQNSLCT